MTLQANLTASLVAAPDSTSDSQFPSGALNITFGFNPNPKAYSVGTSGTPNITDPSSFVTIAGIGAGGEVTQATTLYVRAPSNRKLRLTLADIDGGSDIVSIIEVCGICLLEFPANGYLKLLEVKGAGQIEFWAVGSQ